jgi:hypothetical protein
MKKILLILLLVCIALVENFAQQLNGITVQTIFPPPYSPRLKDYAPDGSNNSMIVILTNTNPNPVQVKLLGEIKGQNNGVRAITKANYQPSGPLTIPGNGIPLQIELFGSNQTMFNEDNLDISGIETQTLISGLIPQGYYELCIKVVPFNQLPANLNGSEPKGCVIIPITYIEPPRTTSPICDAGRAIPATNPQNIVFNWTPCVGNIAGARINYDFYLVKVPDGQNPNDAINNAIERNVGNPFVEKDLQVPNLIYGANSPELSEGLYAWAVVAKDNNEKVFLQNNGRSEVCVFKVGPQGERVSPEASTVKCKNAQIPADLVAVKQTTLVGKTIKLGNFELSVDQAAESVDGWAGNGRITWNYVPIKVKFTKLKVNASDEAITGLAEGSTEGFEMPGVTKPDLSTYKNISVDYLKQYTSTLTSKLWQDIKGQLAVSLPIGYDAGAGLIGINYMTIAPDGADMGALLNVKMPEDNSFLSMAATEMCMLPNKLFPNNAVLYLVKDFKPPYTPITFKQSHYPANDGTYAILTPDSVKHVHVEAEINLGQNVLQLNDSEGNVLPGDVISQLKFDFNRWSDWVATIQLPTFGLKDAKGLSVKGLEAFYDHSDFRNPINFTPPAEYDGDRGNTFMGLYLHRVDVLLPKSLGGGNSRMSFAAQQMIFDKDGFTGRFTPSRYPLLDYTTGRMGKLAFAIDSFEVLIVKNALIRGSMVGKIQLPISTDMLDYSCNLRNGLDTVRMVVKPKAQGYNVPIFLANMKIYPNSSFYANFVKDKDPEISFDLNGEMTIDAKAPIDFLVPDLVFEKFSISSLKSKGGDEMGNTGIYINTGNWNLEGGLFGDNNNGANNNGANNNGRGGPSLLDNEGYPAMAEEGKNQKLGGFPIQLIPPKFVKNNIGLGLEFGVKINVGGEEASLANATGTVQVLGNIEVQNGKLTPVFKGVYPSRFTIAGQFGPAHVEGEIKMFYGNAQHGTGLNGWAKVKIPSLVAVEASILFGKKDDFFYGYMDASVVTNPGFVIVPPLTLTGFGGGLYFNMRQDGSIGEKLESKPLTAEEKRDLSSQPGVTKSGLVYVPQRGAWGLKARVYLSLADARLMTGSVGMEAGFSNGALNNFNANGRINVISKDGMPDDNTALVQGNVAFNYTATGNYDVSADLQVKILTASVQVPFRMHFSPREWHIKLGDPYDVNRRVSFNILDLNLAVVKAKIGANFYMAMGNDLGDMPPLPSPVESFLGTIPNNADAQRNSQINAVKNVGAVGVDSDGKVTSVPDFSILVGGQYNGLFEANVAILSLNAQAIIGFDAALTHGVVCSEGGSTAGGWNGWYAQAQLYAYLKGGAYIDLDVWFASGKFAICTLEAGALLKGGLPNPAWVNGRVKVQGTVLGLIKVNTGFDISLGEQCTPQYQEGSGLDGIAIIGDISPNGGEPVETDEPITVSFNTSIGEDYEIGMPDGSVKTYRFKLKNYSLTYADSKNGGKLTTFDGFAEPEWVNDKQQLILNKNKHFASTSKHTFTIAVAIDEVGGGQANAGKYEERKAVFTSAKQPDYIKFKDIEYTWPLEGQNYFLKGQLPKGLIHGQIPSEAFKATLDGEGNGTENSMMQSIGGGYVYNAVFIPKDGGDTLTTSVTYDNQSDVTFDIPAGLQNEKVYRMEIRRIYKNGLKLGSAVNTMLANSMIRNKATVGRMSFMLRDKEDYFYVNQNSLAPIKAGASAATRTKVVYDIVFKTSKYNTIGEKLAAVNFEKGEYKNTNNSQSNDYLVFDLKPSGSNNENFDDAELFGYNRNGRAIPALLKVATTIKNSGYEAYLLREVYTPIVNFGAKNVNINYGYQEWRKQIGLGTPDNAVAVGRQLSYLSAIASMQTSTSFNIGSSVSTLNNSSASSSSNTGGIIKSIGTPVIGSAINFSRIDNIIGPDFFAFSLEEEPTRAYQFTYRVDHLAYHDFYAVKLFGAKMNTNRQILRNYLGNWKQVSSFPFSLSYGGIDISSSSKSLTLSTTSANMARNFSDSDIDLYNNYQSANYYDFTLRTQGSVGTIRIDYKPTASSPSFAVDKNFTFGTSQISLPPVSPRNYFKF